MDIKEVARKASQVDKSIINAVRSLKQAYRDIDGLRKTIKQIDDEDLQGLLSDAVFDMETVIEDSIMGLNEDTLSNMIAQKVEFFNKTY